MLLTARHAALRPQARVIKAHVVAMRRVTAMGRGGRGQKRGEGAGGGDSHRRHARRHRLPPLSLYRYFIPRRLMTPPPSIGTATVAAPMLMMLADYGLFMPLSCYAFAAAASFAFFQRRLISAAIDATPLRLRHATLATHTPPSFLILPLLLMLYADLYARCADYAAFSLRR